MVSSVPPRDRYLISFCLAIVMALSWAYIVHLAPLSSSADDSAKTMAVMGMAVGHRWTAVDATFTFAMWTVMTVGMMTGSAAPTLLLFAAAQVSRGGRRVLLTVLLFGLGYLVVWVGFSGIATLAQLALQRAGLLSDALAASNPLSVAILIVAGIYQLSPVKIACLTHCRTPLGFLMTNWRDGRAGAFRMGTQHGLFCLGCCWALMVVMFAVGVMSLVWVAVLTTLVLIERLTPAGRALSRVSGLVMIVAGALLLLFPLNS